MKPGAGDDLLEEDDQAPEPDATDEADDRVADVDTDSTTDDVGANASQRADDVPYLLRRTRVKQGRETVGFGLQAETRRLEDEALRDIKAELEVETLHATDLREAAYLAGLQDPEAVKQILLGWGYEHRR